MKAYKGFDSEMKCRGFQFKEGETYEEPEAKLCKRGFHACENPIDCFSYYDPANSVFHEVELDGVSNEHETDSKVVAKKITIGASINLFDMVKAEVEYIKSKVDWDNAKGSNTGNRSAATNTGYRSAATNTGYRSAATNTGNQSAATNTGDCSAATNTGYQSAAEVSGENSIAIVTGKDSKARGALGCWLVLTERDRELRIVDVQAVKVDGNVIKDDTWYKLSNGKIVEV